MTAWSHRRINLSWQNVHPFGRPSALKNLILSLWTQLLSQ